MKPVIKRFLGWMRLKEKLHRSVAIPPLVKESELWWASLGENVGSEINGKDKLFSRPVVIIKKLTHSFYLIAPSTSQPHLGTWYVPVTFSEKKMFVCLHQTRTLEYRRLSTRIGQLDSNDFSKVKEGFWELYK